MKSTAIHSEQPQRVLWNAEEVATMTGLSRGFVYAAISRGELPSVRLGRAVRVRVADVEAWISRNLTGAAA